MYLPACCLSLDSVKFWNRRW